MPGTTDRLKASRTPEINNLNISLISQNWKEGTIFVIIIK